jgi:hypothetical protein
VPLLMMIPLGYLLGSSMVFAMAMCFQLKQQRPGQAASVVEIG